jgi:flagellar motility protein MotE (MotC chaperone)
MKSIRFLPLVALAAFSLLALKLASLMLGEGYILTGTQQTLAQAEPASSKAQSAPKKVDDTGKTAKTSSKKPAKKRNKKDQPPVDITNLAKENHLTSAEIDLLSSLSKRREELDARERELELRQTLLKAAQKNIDERIAALKKLENKIQRFASADKEKKDKQFNKLVKMYSAMKPKGAARIFNELDKKVLIGIIQQMKPQAMSAILAAMEPSKAREMTIALAGYTKKRITENTLDSLPKIQGN